MYRIIVVEDDKGIADGICECLGRWGMEACQIRDFRRVMEEIRGYEPHLVIMDITRGYEPHLVIMDITLPYMSGYHWCTEIRKNSSVPILFISSAADNMNMIMAMNMGADDFIPKPFDQSVLVAKVQALLRRAYDYSHDPFTLQAAGAVLNTDENTLVYNGEKIPLSRNEYRILLTLMQNKNKVVSFVDENTLTVNIGRLRKTLKEAGIRDLIKTRFGVGYILEAD